MPVLGEAENLRYDLRAAVHLIGVVHKYNNSYDIRIQAI